MDFLELRHVATAIGVAALFIGWNLISRRLPGHYGKAVDGAVEIVPTVGMWLSAVLLPIGSLALLALGAVVLLPSYLRLRRSSPFAGIASATTVSG